MIIKKPYGFLIKHFKIIHLLLLVPSVYLLFKFNDISTFFQTFVAHNYKTIEVASAGNYITLLTYIAIIVMILANGIIFLLMKSKKKSTIVYASSLIYYIVLFVLSVIFYSAIGSIYTNTLDKTLVNFLKDVAGFAPLPSYIFLVMYAIKGIGFNFKTMRFDNNLDLHVEDEDEEEIELKINSDGYTTKRLIVHYLRELKYYILENKFVFTCFGLVAIIAIGIGIYMNVEVYNKNYRLYQAFVLDSFSMSVKESYITNVDYSGKIIKEDKYFVALKIAITNLSAEDLAIDSSNFRLYIGKDYVFPSYDRSSRFIDVGKNYQGNTIASQSTADYVFVYELSKEQLKTQYQIRILSDLQVKAGELTPAYKLINIRPTNILKTESLGEAEVGNDIILKDTTLGNTVLKVKSVKFQNAYVYEGQSCIGVDKCQTGKYTLVASPGKTLMVIEDDIKWDETTPYYINQITNFYGDFTTVKYKYKSLLYDNEYTSEVVNVRPETLKNAKVYEVSNMIQTASKVDLNIKIRNKTYTIHIKKEEK